MPRAAATGDIVLTARPATADTFAPFGRLVTAGDRERLGRKGGVLLALDQATPGPRRFLHLQCHPTQRRVFFPLGETPLIVVVLGPGEPPSGPPTAFRIPPGHGVVFAPGVWHAGPHPLEAGAVCEILETQGPVDRMDRRSLRELAGVEAVRVVLPEEPGAPGQRLDLSTPGVVVLDEAVERRATFGFLLLDGLTLADADDAVTAEIESQSAAVRTMHKRITDIGTLPGVEGARALWRSLGLDPARHPTPGERLLGILLEGRTLERENALLDALALCTLALHVPLSAYDADRLGDRLLVRPGAAGEGIGTGSEAVLLQGTPVLADREGWFGSLLGDRDRARVTRRTQRALVVSFLPAEADAAHTSSRLDEISRRLREHCGGRELGRLVTGGRDGRPTEARKGPFR